MNNFMNKIIDNFRSAFNIYKNNSSDAVEKIIYQSENEKIKSIFDERPNNLKQGNNPSRSLEKIRAALNSVKSSVSNSYQFLHKLLFGVSIHSDAFRNINTPQDKTLHTEKKLMNDQTHEVEIMKSVVSDFGPVVLETAPESKHENFYSEEYKNLNNINLDGNTKGYAEFMNFFEDFRKNRNENSASKVKEFSVDVLKFSEDLMQKHKDDKTISNNAELKSMLDAALLIVNASQAKSNEELKWADINKIFEETLPPTVNPSSEQLKQRDVNDKTEFILRAFYPEFEISKDTEEFKKIESDVKKFIGWQQLWSEVIMAESDADLNYVLDTASEDAKKKKISFVQKEKKIAIDALIEKHPMNADTKLACQKFTKLFKVIQMTGTENQKALLEDSDLQKYVKDFDEYLGGGSRFN